MKKLSQEPKLNFTKVNFAELVLVLEVAIEEHENRDGGISLRTLRRMYDAVDKARGKQ